RAQCGTTDCAHPAQGGAKPPNPRICLAGGLGDRCQPRSDPRQRFTANGGDRAKRRRGAVTDPTKRRPDSAYRLGPAVEHGPQVATHGPHASRERRCCYLGVTEPLPQPGQALPPGAERTKRLPTHGAHASRERTGGNLGATETVPE